MLAYASVVDEVHVNCSSGMWCATTSSNSLEVSGMSKHFFLKNVKAIRLNSLHPSSLSRELLADWKWQNDKLAGRWQPLNGH